MEMESNIVLNGIDYKFFLKMIRFKGFKIQKIDLRIKPKGPLKTLNKKKLKWGSKVPFKIKN
jgi:hypothetical protein